MNRYFGFSMSVGYQAIDLVRWDFRLQRTTLYAGDTMYLHKLLTPSVRCWIAMYPTSSYSYPIKNQTKNDSPSAKPQMLAFAYQEQRWPSITGKPSFFFFYFKPQLRNRGRSYSSHSNAFSSSSFSFARAFCRFVRLGPICFSHLV